MPYDQPYGYPIGAIPVRKGYANGTATLTEDWQFLQEHFVFVLAGCDFSFNLGGTPGPFEYILSFTPAGGPSQVTLYSVRKDYAEGNGSEYAQWRGYVPIFFQDFVSIDMSDSGEASQASATFWGYLVPEVLPDI